MVTKYDGLEFPWEAKCSVKKGAAGERFVKDYFEKKDYVVYMPVSNAAHGFDMFLYKNGQYPYAVEVKTKASSEKFNETGIEKYLFDRYAAICDSLKMPLLLIFVDERLQSFYGEFFHKLQQSQTIGQYTYPKLVYGKGGKNPTYFFHVSTMKHLGNLRPLEVEYLKIMGERIKKGE